MKIKSIVLFGLTLSFFLSACGNKRISSEPNKTGVAFYKNEKVTMDEIIDLAKKEDKLIFLDVYADWCGPCKMMDKNVFADKETADFINNNFISYKVNGEKSNGPDINFMFTVLGYPTLLFLDDKGSLIVRNDGMTSKRDLIEIADLALELGNLAMN